MEVSVSTEGVSFLICHVTGGGVCRYEGMRRTGITQEGLNVGLVGRGGDAAT